MVRHPDQVLAAGLLHCGRLCQSGKVRRIDDAMPATVIERMDGHLMEAVVDAHGAVHDCRAHHLADQPPWHRVGIASGAISREQFAAEMASLRTTFEKIVQELTREAKSSKPCLIFWPPVANLNI
jgi:hypothetical protein